MKRDLQLSLEGGILRVAGDLSLDAMSKFKELLGKLLAQSNDQISIDLQKTTFMSSTYIGVIVAALNLARQTERKLIVFTSAQSPRLFEIITIFSAFRNRKAASCPPLISSETTVPPFSICAIVIA